MRSIPSLYRVWTIAVVLVIPAFAACEGTLGDAPDDDGDRGAGSAPGDVQAGSGGHGAGPGGSSGSPAGGAGAGPGSTGSSSSSAGAGTGGGSASSSAASSSASSSAASSSSATSTTSTSSGGTGSDDLQQRCVDTINGYRATLGLAPYARWTDAETCADGEAESDGSSGTAHGSFGRCEEWAQNECPGWGGPADQMIGPCLQAMWNEGPGEPFPEHGHYINMSSTSYTRVACGFHTFPDGSVWATQDFK